jgi:hypothetical protein
MNRSRNTVQRARAGVAGPTPRAFKFRTDIVDPALARIDLDGTFHLALRRNVDALVALLPVHRATFAKLVLEDQSIQNTLRLVHRASDIRIIDRHRTDVALRINDKQRPLRNTLILDQNAIVAAKLMVAVAD